MNSATRTITALSIAVTLGGAAALYADDSAMSGTSGSVKPLQSHPSVRMVAEEVTIDNPADAHVKATFHFRNEGPALNVLMGFPAQSSGDAGDMRGKLNDFHSWIDGSPITVTNRKAPDGDEGGPYEDWLIKTVPFGENQTRTVVDTYRGGGGEVSDGERWFTYVLTTGSNWKGPIGRARVTCNLGSLSGFSPIEISPAGYHRSGNIITWDMRDIEPTKNIEIRWTEAFMNVRVNGKYPWQSQSSKDEQKSPIRVQDFAYDMEFRTIGPVRRGNDVWLPAKLAAKWLDAKFAVQEAGKRVRVKRGSRWADVTVGSSTVRLSSGKTITMASASNYQQNKEDPAHPFTMTSLRTLVTAFGGTMTYNTAANRMDISIPSS